MNKTVKDLLLEKVELFDRKGLEYGHTYKEFGNIIKSLFGEEIKITSKNYNRFFIFTMILHKIHRTAKTILTDSPSIDSIKDLQVYSAMLEEICSE
jgi:hypothetical protein